MASDRKVDLENLNHPPCAIEPLPVAQPKPLAVRSAASVSFGKLLIAIILVANLLVATMASPLAAQEESPASGEVPDEVELPAEFQALKDRIIHAGNERQLVKLLDEFAPGAIFTWHDGRRTHGLEEFKKFYNSMMVGDQSFVVSANTRFTVDNAPQMFGESTVVVSGTAKDNFELRDGRTIKLDSKWTTTLVLDSNEQWKVAAYHVSSNVLNNPILSTAKKWLLLLAITGALLGFLLGVLVTRFVMTATRRLVNEL